MVVLLEGLDWVGGFKIPKTELHIEKITIISIDFFWFNGIIFKVILAKIHHYKELFKYFF